MSKAPSAKQFFDNYAKEHLDSPSWEAFICGFEEDYVSQTTFEIAVLFGMWHVTEVKKAIKEKASVSYNPNKQPVCWEINPESIEKAYSIDQIK